MQLYVKNGALVGWRAADTMPDKMSLITLLELAEVARSHSMQLGQLLNC